jgi:hypothetical protein
MKIYKVIIIGLLVFCDSSFGNWTSPLEFLRNSFRDVEVTKTGISFSLSKSGGKWLISDSKGYKVGNYGEKVEADQYVALVERHHALRISILEMADGSRILLVEDRADPLPFGGELTIEYYAAILGENNELMVPSAQAESLAIDLLKAKYPWGKIGLTPIK